MRSLLSFTLACGMVPIPSRRQALCSCRPPPPASPHGPQETIGSGHARVPGASALVPLCHCWHIWGSPVVTATCPCAQNACSVGMVDATGGSFCRSAPFCSPHSPVAQRKWLWPHPSWPARSSCYPPATAECQGCSKVAGPSPPPPGSHTGKPPLVLVILEHHRGLPSPRALTACSLWPGAVAPCLPQGQ